MGRDPVKVCVRTRPTSSFAQDVIVIDKESQVLGVRQESRSFGSLPSTSPELFWSTDRDILGLAQPLLAVFSGSCGLHGGQPGLVITPPERARYHSGKTSAVLAWRKLLGMTSDRGARNRGQMATELLISCRPCILIASVMW